MESLTPLVLMAAALADAAGAFVAPPGMVARGQAQRAAARLLPPGSERRARLACAARGPTMPVCMSQDKMGEEVKELKEAGRGTQDRVSELFAGTLSDRPWGALFTGLACSSTFRDKMWTKAQILKIKLYCAFV
jgi:hypothetical protein